MDDVQKMIAMDEAKKLAEQWGREDRKEWMNTLAETGKDIDGLLSRDIPDVQNANFADEGARNMVMAEMVPAYRFGLYGPSDYDEEAMKVLQFFASVVDGHLDDDHDPVLYGLIQAGLVKIEIVAKPGPETTEAVWKAINGHPNDDNIDLASKEYPFFFGTDEEEEETDREAESATEQR